MKRADDFVRWPYRAGVDVTDELPPGHGPLHLLFAEARAASGRWYVTMAFDAMHHGLLCWVRDLEAGACEDESPLFDAAAERQLARIGLMPATYTDLALRAWAFVQPPPKEGPTSP